jgi:uncharacterized membrane protein YkvA (DUF1232 family)
MNKGQEDFYLKLRSEIKKFLNTHHTKYADILLIAPDLFHLLVKLSLDDRVPVDRKVKFVAVIAYFISPVDLFPEIFFGPIGYLDDIALAAYILNNYINETDANIVAELWAGEQDILDILKKIINVADSMLGSGLWRRVKRYLGKNG